MKEVEEEIKELVSKRFFQNSIYFLFLVSWCIVHWRFFVVLLTVPSEDIIKTYGVTKDIYIKSFLFDVNYWGISIFVFALPFLILLFIVYVVQPYFMPTLLSKNKEYEDNRLKIEEGNIKKERNIINEKVEILDKKEELLSKEYDFKKEEEARFEKDIKEFYQTIYKSKIEDLEKCIFTFDGHIFVSYSDEYSDPETIFELDKSFLAYLILNDYVSKSEAKVGCIEITNKGKYLLKKNKNQASFDTPF